MAPIPNEKESSMPIDAVVTLLVDGSGVFVEHIDAASAAQMKKKKTRQLKKDYKELLKPGVDFMKTNMADPDHCPIYLTKNDTVKFVCFEAFTITFDRDPDIDEEFSAADAPFQTITGSTPLTGPQPGTDVTGAAGPDRFQ